MAILVVDDDEGIREVICAVLEQDGYTWRCAENGLEALAEVQRGDLDLIILDMLMPIMDGWTFLERYRSRLDLPQVPVIIFSAVPQQMVGVTKAQAYIPKPFDLDDLLSTITAMLAESAVS